MRIFVSACTDVAVCRAMCTLCKKKRKATQHHCQKITKSMMLRTLCLACLALKSLKLDLNHLVKFHFFLQWTVGL